MKAESQHLFAPAAAKAFVNQGDRPRVRLRLPIREIRQVSRVSAAVPRLPGVSREATEAARNSAAGSSGSFHAAKCRPGKASWK